MELERMHIYPIIPRAIRDPLKIHCTNSLKLICIREYHKFPSRTKIWWRNLEKLKLILYVQFDMSTMPISMKCTKFIRIKTYFSLHSYKFIKSIHFSFILFSFFDIFSFQLLMKNSFLTNTIVSVAFGLVRIFSINMQWKFRHDNFASLYLNREKTNQHWNSVEFFSLFHFCLIKLIQLYWFTRRTKKNRFSWKILNKLLLEI